MVARIAEVEDRERGSRLARARENCRHTAFKRGDLLRDLVVRRVRETRVEITGLLEVEKIRHLLARLILERGRRVDRHLARLALLRLPSALHAQRVNCHLLFPFSNRFKFTPRAPFFGSKDTRSQFAQWKLYHKSLVSGIRCRSEPTNFEEFAVDALITIPEISNPTENRRVPD